MGGIIALQNHRKNVQWWTAGYHQQSNGINGSHTKALTQSCDVQLFTDSKYVLEGYTMWMSGWKSRGWKKSDKKPVLNQELWKQLDEQGRQHNIEWHWVKGHSGHAENERVDQLARLEAEKIKDIYHAK